MTGEQKAPREGKPRDELHGGTGHVGTTPAVGDDLAEGGSADVAAPSGGVHPPPPSKAGPPLSGKDVAVKEPKGHKPNEEGPGAKKV